MSKWVKGNFKNYEKHIMIVPIICTMKFVETVPKQHGTYNIYHVKPWNRESFYAVVFSNSIDLAPYVAINEGNLLSVKVLEEQCAISTYVVNLADGHTVAARTIVAAMVIARKPVAEILAT